MSAIAAAQSVEDAGRPGAADLRQFLQRLDGMTGRVLNVAEVEHLAQAAGTTSATGAFSEKDDRVAGVTVWGQASEAVWREVDRIVRHVCKAAFPDAHCTPPTRLAGTARLWVIRVEPEGDNVTEFVEDHDA